MKLFSLLFVLPIALKAESINYNGDWCFKSGSIRLVCQIANLSDDQVCYALNLDTNARIWVDCGWWDSLRKENEALGEK